MQLNKVILRRIEEDVRSSILSEKRIGVHDGLSGIGLFYTYLLKVFPEKEFEVNLQTVVGNLNDLISENEYNFSLSTGLAGYAYLLSFCSREKIFEIGNQYINSLDEILIDGLTNHANQDDYDFMHGATGILLYLLKRLPQTGNPLIEKTLITVNNELIAKLIQNPKAVCYTFTGEGKKSLYFGLAHGISGLINYLIYAKNRLNHAIEDIAPAIGNIFEILEDNSLVRLGIKSSFTYPSSISEDRDITDARLGWCQGDLSIANSLYNSGTFLNNENMIVASKNLIANSLELTFKDTKVCDFALCHGTTGLLLQYNLLSRKMSYNHTLDFKINWEDILEKQTENYTQFKYYYDERYIPETNLLNGSAGLGLTLLSIHNDIDFGWAECLNLY